MRLVQGPPVVALGEQVHRGLLLLGVVAVGESPVRTVLVVVPVRVPIANGGVNFFVSICYIFFFIFLSTCLCCEQDGCKNCCCRDVLLFHFIEFYIINISVGGRGVECT